MNTTPEAATISIVMLTCNDLSSATNGISTLIPLLGNDLLEELLILDNGSTDGTREFLESLRWISKVHLLFSDTNLGVASGRDRLFKQAQGKIIASLDSDVQVHGLGYFERAKELLYLDCNVAICGASGYRVKLWNGRLYLKPCNRNRDVDCVSGFCQIFRREILSEIRMSVEFSPFWCEDTDFCFQAIDNGYTIRHLDAGLDLSHTYRSIKQRQNDPLKLQHEQLLARKWEGRLSLLGESRLASIYNCLRSAGAAFKLMRAGYERLATQMKRYLH